MNSRYYDLRGKIVKAERRITTLTERGEMWEQYNQYKSIHKQLAKVKPEKREQFEQRHSRELILYDAAARYLKELKDSGEAITPKAWQREIDQLATGKQVDTLAMKSMREDLKAVERLRKTAEQLSKGTGQPPDRGRGGERPHSTPLHLQNKTPQTPPPRQTVYLPNKSLCVPVRASVSTRTSSSMR